MEKVNNSHNVDNDPRPPPYSPYDPQSSHSGMGYQVGKGNIAVVSPPTPYNNTVHPGDQTEFDSPAYDQTPPEYLNSSEGNAFSDAAIRRAFIRKVYLILMVQLLVTVGIICAFLYWEELRKWTEDHNWFSYTMMVSVLVLIMALSCCGELRRKVPINFIALGLFTIAEGLMLGSVTVYFNAEAVLWAVGATALVSFALSVFAMQSKWDFTAASGSLWVFGWTLFSFAILCAVLRSQYVYITYACLGTLLFSLYLVFDTQRMLGGTHKKYAVSPEEYVFAALNLYVDIITIFLLLLQLIGLCR